jgi:hypothetical protein
MADEQGRIHVIPAKETVDVGGGFRAPRTIKVDVTLAGYEGVTVQIGITLSNGAYKVSRVRLDADEGAVTGDLMRQVPLKVILTMSVDFALQQDEPGPFLSPDTVRSETDLLKVTAFTYRRARLLGEAPVSAVMKAEKVSRSTASRRVAAARSAGFLGPDEKGHVGGAPSQKRLGL